MNKNVILPLLACGCLFATACPKQAPQNQAIKPAKPASQTDPQPAMSGNLFDNTPMSTETPVNVALDRAGDSLLFNLLPRIRQGDLLPAEQPVQVIVSADFVGGQLLDTQEVFYRDGLAKAYLSSHPDGDRGLVISNYQFTGQPVIDEVIEVRPGATPRVLRYEETPGIPGNAPPDDKYGIEASYSWDGETVVIPLKYSGIVVYNLASEERNYIPYPQLDYPRTGKSIQALEDQNGKRRMLVSVYAQEVYVDSCKLYTLDLDTLEYKQIADLKWVAYNVGCTDYDNEPWLVTGSRGRETAVDIKRTPLLFMLDPSGSSAQDSVQFYGDPIWQVEVSTHGDTVVYLDQQREAIVRLTPMTGEMEIDREHYNADGKLLVSADGKNVFIWERDELYAADFSETESFPAYGEQ